MELSFYVICAFMRVVSEGLQLSIEIQVFLMGRYVCVVQQHGQAMISEVHLSYLNTEVHQM